MLFYRTIEKDDRLRPQHLSLYFAILLMGKEEHNTGTVSVTRRELMELSRLTSKATYHRCIRELEHYGYIQYHPSYNPFLGSRVVLKLIA